MAPRSKCRWTLYCQGSVQKWKKSTSMCHRSNTFRGRGIFLHVAHSYISVSEVICGMYTLNIIKSLNTVYFFCRWNQGLVESGKDLDEFKWQGRKCGSTPETYPLWWANFYWMPRHNFEVPKEVEVPVQRQAAGRHVCKNASKKS